MRWIVLFLSFANTGYFAWGMFDQFKSGYEVSTQPASELPKNGRRLILVSETPSAQPQKTPSEPTQKQVSKIATANVSGKECLTLGPFNSTEEADQVQQRLFSLGISSRERAEENNQAADYWVHIPPLPSRDAAIRLLRELQAQNIDSFVITQGELANGISLGLFSKQDSAKKVSRRLMAAGYSVEVKSLSRVPERWWLEMDAAEENKLDSFFWSELDKRIPDIKKTKKPCEGIASGT